MTTAARRGQRRLLGLRRAVQFTIAAESKRVAIACAWCRSTSCAGCRRAIVDELKVAH
jgi:hypothetical protein